ncbi:MAG: HAD family phosphatase [Acidobacteria bacterium]|nr:HAD family phosphatase [Acidobacteriota bacterium]
MLRAIIFDCDGVIADTEPLHLGAFQEVFLGEGILLSTRDYFEKYLGTDDRDCFRLVFQAQGRPLSEDQLLRLIERKAKAFAAAAPASIRIYDGVVPFARSAAGRYLMAVASGALRSEVEMVLEAASIRSLFKVVIGAEDVTKGKPSPEGFLLAMERLDGRLAPSECVVIEDSMQGVQAARRAGMRCLALTTSYPRELLTLADWIVPTLAAVTPEQLAGWISPSDAPQVS